MKKYGKFKLNDIFKIYHGKRLTKADRIKGDIPLLTAGEQNQGIAEYIDNDRPQYDKSITIDMFGNTFYHDYKCIGDDNIYFFINDKISHNAKLYIVSKIYKKIKNVYSYAKQFRQNDADNLSIELPIKDSIEEKEKYGIDDIDYEYMEERIKELEEERIKELEEYLRVSGLENYEISAEDEEVLKKKVEFKEFKVGEVFELVNPKGKLNTKQLIEGNDIPYVGAKKTYNGIVKMCSKENIPEEQIMKGNAIIFVQQGDGSAGYTTYQPNRFYAISCVCCGYWDKLNENIAMYIMPELDKNKMLYSHSQSWSTERIKETRLHLPVDKKGQIDYEYMDNYIQAIKKKTIAGVVKYKDQVIEITKKVVAKTNKR